MTTTKENPKKVWYRTDFAIESGDRCQCYKHRSKTGKPKRCPIREGSVGLSDPDRSIHEIHRIYCIDCWIGCRDEVTQANPVQKRVYEQMRRQSMTLRNIGC